jgi:aspartate kinase
MRSHVGVASLMFRTLAEEGINMQMISTSEIKISALLARSQAQIALSTVHRSFELHRAPPDAYAPQLGVLRQGPGDNAVAVVTTLQQMEGLTVDEIALDESQARLTIANVADRPGIAAEIFDAVADGGIFVDMIVQSFGRDGKANLSFTVPQEQFPASLKMLDALANRLHCGPVSSSPRVAKLSISGIGMRSHTAVAIRTFECLARCGINVEMINTSEVRVNVVVDGQHGQKTLAGLRQAFADALR